MKVFGALMSQRVQEAIERRRAALAVSAGRARAEASAALAEAQAAAKAARTAEEVNRARDLFAVAADCLMYAKEEEDRLARYR